jgi:polysaccharide chain length determinant protein (PEP-CTERM system associated)
MKEQLNQILGYLHGMWCYRWSGIFISWLVALLGWFAVLSLPNQYESKAVVYIDTESVLKPLLRGLAVETDTMEELTVISRILLSRENLLSVIRETDMDLTIHNTEDKERLLIKLAEKIQIKGGGRFRRNAQNIYELSYKADSPQRVYRVVSVLLNTMIENLLSSSRKDTVVAQKFLDDQIKEYEGRLKIAEKKLADFKKENIGLMPDEKGGYYARLQTAQNKVDETVTLLRLAMQRRAELYKQLSGEKPLLNSASSESTVVDLIKKYQQQLELLLTKYTERHPDVVTLQLQIEELQSNPKDRLSVANPGKNGEPTEFNPVYQDLRIEATKADVEVEALKVQLSEQERIVNELKGLVDAIPEVEARLAELNRDYEVTHQRYLELVDRRESARMADVAGKSSSEMTIRIIEAPVVPAISSGPSRRLFLFMVLIVALGIGLGWCIVRYMINPTVTNTRQLRQELEIPVFGSVSNNLTKKNIVKRKIQLSTFLSSVLLLIAMFTFIIWFSDSGSELVRGMIDENKIQKAMVDLRNSMEIEN